MKMKTRRGRDWDGEFKGIWMAMGITKSCFMMRVRKFGAEEAIRMGGRWDAGMSHKDYSTPKEKKMSANDVVKSVTGPKQELPPLEDSYLHPRFRGKTPEPQYGIKELINGIS